MATADGAKCRSHRHDRQAHAEGYRVAQDAAEIFIVEGRSGSYDSSQEWPVCACWSMDEASALAAQINDAIVEYVTYKVTSHYRDGEQIRWHFVNVLGFPEGTMPYGDLDGIRFYAYSVPLLKRK